VHAAKGWSSLGQLFPRRSPSQGRVGEPGAKTPPSGCALLKVVAAYTYFPGWRVLLASLPL